MQGIRRYLLTNSLERAYQLFYIPKTIKKGILESVKQKPEQEYPGAREMKRQGSSFMWALPTAARPMTPWSA